MLTYALAFLPYLAFLLCKKYLWRLQAKRLARALLKVFSLKLILPILIIWGSLQAIDAYRLGENFAYAWDHSVENKLDQIRDLYAEDCKQRGIHIFNLLSDSTDLEILKTNNIEWLTIVPFIGQEAYNTPSLRSGFRRRDSLPRFYGTKQIKRLADAYGFKIMLKPHIWLSDPPPGIWRSKINMQSEEDWKLWFETYTRHMMAYAELAEEIGIDMFCIGTELHTPVVEQPQAWLDLIQKIKTVYTGQLTYAANWSNEVEHIPFLGSNGLYRYSSLFPNSR